MDNLQLQANNKQFQTDMLELIAELEARFRQKQLNLDELASVKGFGEISSVIQFDRFPELVIKRLPIFESKPQAEKYQTNFNQYNVYLEEAGLSVAQAGELIFSENKQTSLYILQPAFSSNEIGNNALRAADGPKRLQMLQLVMSEIDKVFTFNESREDIAISIDGQISNWVFHKERVVYIDTSTPLYRIGGQEQLEYELLLTSTPAALRGIIRTFFLQDVLDRYYQKRLVYIDLIANLHKEGMPELLPDAIKMANTRLSDPISLKEVNSYYREDKLIWQVFLAFRKIDRWLHRNLWRQPYQYILPDRINR